jgi:hypothetical protein
MTKSHAKPEYGGKEHVLALVLHLLDTPFIFFNFSY